MSSDNSMDYSDEEMVVHHLPTPTSPVEAHLFSQFTVKTPSESVFICPDCNHTFHRAHNLKSHQATHSTTKPFQVILHTCTLHGSSIYPSPPLSCVYVSALTVKNNFYGYMI